MASVRVAINGFGRIGRTVVRAARRSGADIELVAINDLADAPTLAHLLEFDSSYGRFPASVGVADGRLEIDGRPVTVLSQSDPGMLPWRDLGVDVVLECTGRFRKRAQAALHLQAGARKVAISAPAEDPDLTVCLGVNAHHYDVDRHHVVSNASCTTNCLAPVAKVLHQELTIEKGWMTTVHSMTSDQRILDLPHKDLRRARAASVSIIPTSTGAARALGLVLPELTGKIDGCSVRVPTPSVSLVDLVCKVQRPTTEAQVNGMLRAAAAGPLAGILAVSDRPLVSVDYVGEASSAVVDAGFTRVVDGDLVQVIAWYDNEMGYSMRLVELVQLLGAGL